MSTIDSDAWKKFEKQGKLEQAFQNCEIVKQKKCIATELAEKLLDSGNAKQSVNYFVESNLSLKAVYEKFAKKKYFDELVDYLKLKKKVTSKN